MRVIIWKYKTY